MRARCYPSKLAKFQIIFLQKKFIVNELHFADMLKKKENAPYQERMPLDMLPQSLLILREISACLDGGGSIDEAFSMWRSADGSVEDPAFEAKRIYSMYIQVAIAILEKML